MQEKILSVMFEPQNSLNNRKKEFKHRKSAFVISPLFSCSVLNTVHFNSQLKSLIKQSLVSLSHTKRTIRAGNLRRLQVMSSLNLFS